ncbi:cyclin-dependent kinase 2-interacting protein isoform X2 [Ursus americanus]|uniref:cyclin-dependent kinase 2-interacting protein isoform X2 n=1 Tax=Ursus americanus TaxID=9643 RepID=UPI001E67DDFB|nr:cyclin-dependent kinase 2-interacting protein isoform X2 [Ursus americanus]
MPYGVDGNPGVWANTVGSTTPRKPVLSVSARKIKDNAADWHNLILKWETLNDTGFATANSIANLKIRLCEDETELQGSSPASREGADKTLPEYSKELEMLCEELQTTFDALAKIQMKMEKLSSTTKGVCELENYRCADGRPQPPLFHTWPTTHFYLDLRVMSSSPELKKKDKLRSFQPSPQKKSTGNMESIYLNEVSRKLSDMYRKELLLKRTVTEELAHAADRDLALSYLSMWLHQPYVETDSKLLLESMLLETGHRAL